MSGAVQIHIPDVRLAGLIRTPGGKPVVESMADAQRGLDSLQADCLAQLSTSLDQCEAIVAGAATGFDPRVTSDLYALVSATIGLPGACGLTSVDTMLVSLADLLDHFLETGIWDANAVAVHLRAFRLLLHTEAARDGAGAAAILDGLKRVSRRYAAPEPRSD
jgi:hypothetical protein